MVRIVVSVTYLRNLCLTQHQKEVAFSYRSLTSRFDFVPIIWLSRYFGDLGFLFFFLCGGGDCMAHSCVRETTKAGREFGHPGSEVIGTGN